MNKDYVIGLGLGMLILAVISISFSHDGNKITGMADAAPSSPNTVTVTNVPTGVVTLTGVPTGPINPGSSSVSTGGITFNINNLPPITAPQSTGITTQSGVAQYNQESGMIIITGPGAGTYRIEGGGAWTRLVPGTTTSETMYSQQGTTSIVTHYVNGQQSTVTVTPQNSPPATIDAHLFNAQGVRYDSTTGTWNVDGNHAVITSQNQITYTTSSGTQGYVRNTGTNVEIFDGNDLRVMNYDGQPNPNLPVVHNYDPSTGTGSNWLGTTHYTVTTGANGQRIYNVVDDAGHITQATTTDRTTGAVTTVSYNERSCNGGGPYSCIDSVHLRYTNGDTGDGEVNDQGQITYTSRYNPNGDVVSVTSYTYAGTTATPTMHTYSISPDGSNYYECNGCIIHEETVNGQDVLVGVMPDGTRITNLHPMTEDQVNHLPTAMTRHVTTNGWSTGRIVRDIGETIAQTEQIYNSLNAALGVSNWLDRHGALPNWAEGFDRWLATQGLGTEYFISNRCSHFLQNENNPSTIAQGRPGGAYTHIEGYAVSTAVNVSTRVVPAFLYTITFYVDANILVDMSTKRLFYLAVYDANNNEYNLLLNVNTPTSYALYLGNDILNVSAIGASAIVRANTVRFTKVCMKFSPLDAYTTLFRQSLNDGKLCNNLQDNNNAQPPEGWIDQGHSIIQWMTFGIIGGVPSSASTGGTGAQPGQNGATGNNGQVGQGGTSV